MINPFILSILMIAAGSTILGMYFHSDWLGTGIYWIFAGVAFAMRSTVKHHEK